MFPNKNNLDWRHCYVAWQTTDSSLTHAISFVRNRHIDDTFIIFKQRGEMHYLTKDVALSSWNNCFVGSERTQNPWTTTPLFHGSACACLQQNPQPESPTETSKKEQCSLKWKCNQFLFTRRKIDMSCQNSPSQSKEAEMCAGTNWTKSIIIASLALRGQEVNNVAHCSLLFVSLKTF